MLRSSRISRVRNYPLGYRILTTPDEGAGSSVLLLLGVYRVARTYTRRDSEFGERESMRMTRVELHKVSKVGEVLLGRAAQLRHRSSGPDAARVIEGPLLQRTHALRLRGNEGQFLAITAEHDQGGHAAAAPSRRASEPAQTLNCFLRSSACSYGTCSAFKLRARARILLAAIARHVDDGDGLAAVLAGL